MRKRLEAQMTKLLRYDEEQFALRLASAVRTLPEDSKRPNFTVLVRQLWTDGAQEATLSEWEETLPKRWAELLRSLGGLAEGVVVEGSLDDFSVEALAELLVTAQEHNQLVSDWQGAPHG